jgi:hypothetical protein
MTLYGKGISKRVRVLNTEFVGPPRSAKQFRFNSAEYFAKRGTDAAQMLRKSKQAKRYYNRAVEELKSYDNDPRVVEAVTNHSGFSDLEKAMVQRAHYDLKKSTMSNSDKALLRTWEKTSDRRLQRYRNGQSKTKPQFEQQFESRGKYKSRAKTPNI